MDQNVRAMVVVWTEKCARAAIDGQKSPGHVGKIHSHQSSPPPTGGGGWGGEAGRPHPQIPRARVCGRIDGPRWSSHGRLR
jgi:hypothetical protein